MSGRIAAIDAVREGQRLTVYIGSASGGVFLTPAFLQQKRHFFFSAFATGAPRAASRLWFDRYPPRGFRTDSPFRRTTLYP